MRLSVIIATKDRAEFLDAAIESLGKQIGAPPFEVVVVDNGSTDATAQVVERQRREKPFEIAYVYEERPNRGAARNRAIAVATGFLAVFCDDDVSLPPGFLAAHEAAHTTSNLVVSGPILNVPSYRERPKPSFSNYSRAFLCTCNASVPLAALRAVRGFDEQFHLYGWEDTELGVRLRERGLRARFSWDAYLWHIKPEVASALDEDARKAIEKARMAARFVKKNPSSRARLATGAYALNLLRARALEPLIPWLAGVAADEHLHPALRTIARAQLLDGLYTQELRRALPEDDARER